MDHLPDEYKADVRRKMQNAYAMVDYDDAKRALERMVSISTAEEFAAEAGAS